jgi:hypothetical protein
VLRGTGQGLEAQIELSPQAVDELLGAHLPAGSSLRPVGGAAHLALATPKLVVPFQAFLDAPAGAPLDLRKALAGADVALEAKLGDWSFSDAELAAAKQTLELRGLALTASIAEHDGRLPAQTKLAGNFGGDARATLAVEASAFDALELPEVWTRHALGEVKLAVRAPQLPMAVARGARAGHHAAPGRAGGARLGRERGLEGGAAARSRPRRDRRRRRRGHEADRGRAHRRSARPQPSAACCRRSTRT